jgi:M6 family metalloprotease-like protein
VQEILDKADRDIDFSQFDNDGADGVPNSGDDDGEVDYLIVMIRERPRNFIVGQADGYGSLGFDDNYFTSDTGANGKPIEISGVLFRGAVAREFNFAQTMGVAVHEYGHGFGLPDLYHTTLKTAGIGKWGLMGAQGALGFDFNKPSPLSAWSREELG